MAEHCPHCYPCRHSGASNKAERYELALRMILHATKPTPADGGGHENAYSIALLALGDKASAGGSSPHRE